MLHCWVVSTMARVLFLQMVTVSPSWRNVAAGRRHWAQYSRPRHHLPAGGTRVAVELTPVAGHLALLLRTSLRGTPSRTLPGKGALPGCGAASRGWGGPRGPEICRPPGTSGSTWAGPSVFLGLSGFWGRGEFPLWRNRLRGMSAVPGCRSDAQPCHRGLRDPVLWHRSQLQLGSELTPCAAGRPRGGRFSSGNSSGFLRAPWAETPVCVSQIPCAHQGGLHTGSVVAS